MSEPGNSVSQGVTGVIDTGAESFSVDNIQPAETNVNPGSNAPAEVKAEVQQEDTQLPDGDAVETQSGDDPETGEDNFTDHDTDHDAEFMREDDPKGVQKRIGTLTRKYREQERLTETEIQRRIDAEREAEALRVENEALRKQPEQVREKPKYEDFNSEEEYLDALTDWKVDQRLAKNEAERREKDLERAQVNLEQIDADRARRINEAMEKGIEKYPDFKRTVENVQIPTATLPVLETLDNAADVAYHLGKNPNQAAKLSNMDPVRAGAELQRISSSLKSRKITNAPDPIKPVSSKGGHVKSIDEMSMAEYNAYRKKQDEQAKTRW